MEEARSRFTTRAIALVGLVSTALVLIVAGISMAVARLGATPERTTFVIVLGATLLAAGLVGGPLVRARALWLVQREHPESPVFLARREPVAMSDLQVYQYRKNNFADIGDKWIPVLVDARGISVWSAGMQPREVLLMEWAEFGSITVTSFDSLKGKQYRGLSMEVLPYPTPLLVRVGHATLGMEGSLDSAGISAVGDAINSLRARL